MRSAALIVLVLGCGDRGRSSPATPPPPPVAIVPPVVETMDCKPIDFADETPLPEASGAAWLTIDGQARLVATSDSGHHGAFAVIDPETGKTVEQGTWALGSGSDDVEGLATRGDRIFGITSAGFIRAWQRQGAGFALVDGPYPVGTGDLVCDADDTNCGPNYEGLCLATKPSTGPCTGFAVAKETGELRCVVERGGKLAVVPEPRIHVGASGAIADCAFDDADRLWVGANLFGLNTVFRVDGWTDPAKAKVVAIGAYGVGFAEVIAVRGDDIYRMSDTGGKSASKMAKFRCSSTGR